MIELPELAGVRHREVALDSVRLHVAEMGPDDARPLLLVHGWPQNWWCWRKVAPRLAPEYRCVMPDLRGFGWSEATPGGYEKDRLADDLLALLDRLEMERVGFIGHDWGAYIGMLLGMRETGRLSALLALSIPHPWPSWRDRLNPLRIAAFTYQIPLSAPLAGELLVRGGAVRAMLRRAATEDVFTEHDLDVFDRPLRSAEQARATVSLYRTFLVRELPSIATGRFARARIRVPVRLLVGNGDPIVKGADLRGFEPHAVDMQVDRVPGAGHFLPEEAPDLVVRHARELFAVNGGRNPDGASVAQRGTTK
jgi:pimeloyl-ACP methyl ester carboxylesterase